MIEKNAGEEEVNLEVLAEQFYILNKRIKEDEEALKVMKAELKARCPMDDEKHTTVKTRYGSVVIIRSWQDRSKMNDEKLVSLLKELKLADGIKTVEVPDFDNIAILEKMGYITKKQLATCIDPVWVDTIKPEVVK